MPRVKERERKKVSRAHQEKLLKHLDEHGLATSETFGKEFNVKKVRLSGNSLKDRALKKLVNEGRIDYVRTKFRGSPDKRVFFSTDYEKTYRKALDLLKKGDIDKESADVIINKLRTKR